LITGKTPRGYDPLADVDRYDPLVLLDDLAKVSPGSEKDPAAVSDYLLRFTLGGEAQAERLAVLRDHFAAYEGVTVDSVSGALCLIATMPEYQLC